MNPFLYVRKSDPPRKHRVYTKQCNKRQKMNLTDSQPWLQVAYLAACIPSKQAGTSKNAEYKNHN